MLSSWRRAKKSIRAHVAQKLFLGRRLSRWKQNGIAISRAIPKSLLNVQLIQDTQPICAFLTFDLRLRLEGYFLGAGCRPGSVINHKTSRKKKEREKRLLWIRGSLWDERATDLFTARYGKRKKIKKNSLTLSPLSSREL